MSLKWRLKWPILVWCENSYLFHYSGENKQLPMSVKFVTRAKGKCCSHTNWQSLFPHEWNTLFFPTRLVKIILSPSALRRENSNSYEISHSCLKTDGESTIFIRRVAHVHFKQNITFSTIFHPYMANFEILGYFTQQKQLVIDSNYQII